MSGQSSISSVIPSSSVSLWDAEQPYSSTSSPSGVSGQLSISSVILSESVSFCEFEQPYSSTSSPAGVSGQSSTSPVIPSPSVSLWETEQPYSSTSTPSGVSGHSSRLLPTQSSSASSPSEKMQSFTVIELFDGKKSLPAGTNTSTIT